MTRLVQVVASVLVLALAACGGDDGDGGNPNADAAFDGSAGDDGGSEDGGGGDAGASLLGVACFGATCPVGDACCVSDDGSGEDGFCPMPFEVCPGTEYACDGPEDCGSQQECCVLGAGPYTSECRTAADCTAAGGDIVCHTTEDCRNLTCGAGPSYVMICQ